MANTGQMLLVLGSLILFSILLPSVNSSLLYNDRTLVSTHAELAAMSIAQKIINEANRKVFDEICLTSRPTSATLMTTPAHLGPDTGESYPNFDDVDDFKNLSIADSLTMASVRFSISATVTYVDPGNPTVDVAYQTYIKRLRVSVTGPYLVNPASNTPVQITMEQLYAYY
ncbi:MAG: hypothetical protein NTW14_06160 [bacterium]|nr:hypothetical protein [bacterium]